MSLPGAPRFSVTDRGLVDRDGTAHRFVSLDNLDASPEWRLRQENSVKYYPETADAYPLVVQQAYRAYEGYIARALLGRTALRILDVGCGTDPAFPPYVRFLREARARTGNIYVGLDPFEENLQREYSFICGRLEQLPSFVDTKFDVFLFATSLDHLESLAAVGDTLRRLSAPGAIGLFWVGLHDVELILDSIGGALLVPILEAGGWPLRAYRMAKFCGYTLPRLLLTFDRRKRQLRKGELVDDVHFHNFTRGTIDQALGEMGRIEDAFLMPDGNYFATVKVSD